MNKIKKAINILRGKTPEGLDKNFAHALGEYIRANKDKCDEWKRHHPGEFLPLGIGPEGTMVWMDRATRRKVKQHGKKTKKG